MKKTISLFLSIMMLLCTFSEMELPVYAMDSGGSCGENVLYAFDSNTRILTISGTGEMSNYNGTNSLSPFYNQNDIRTLIIGDGITSIGNMAFSGCSSLTSITIPDSVTSIGDFAFSGCTGLTSITIPDSVTTINHNAFCNCTGLTSITIPDSVTNIGNFAFNGCKGLTSITVGNNNQNYSSQDGVLFNKDKTMLIQYPTGNDRAGYIVPNSVTSIGNSAFSYSKSLTSIVLNSVTSIGGGAFGSCSNLTSIELNDGLTSIGEAAFRDCTGLTSVEIPDSVTSIGEYAFYSCTGLTSVTIGSNVTNIGKGVFNYCDSLIGIIVDSNNNHYCSQGGVLFNKEKTTLIAYPSGNSRTSYIIPDSVTSIDEYAFYHCTGLTSITIPDGVISIGVEAFRGCTGLTSITIPDSVTSIGSSAFYGCTGLTNIKIPESVTTISSQAFRDCRGLTSITIPDSVTSIGDYAFYGCIGLTSITIPDGVTSLGNYAFYACDLKSITIPHSVSSIGDVAFNISVKSDIHYVGSNTDWDSIAIGIGNTFGNPTFHYLQLIEEKDATCKISGNNAYYYCSTCNKYFKESNEVTETTPSAEKIPATGIHTYDEGVVIAEPTCITTGIKKYTCVFCGAEKTEEVPISGIHTYDDGVITTESTCVKNGIKTFTCTVCGTSYTEPVPLAEHTPVIDEEVEATCSTTGLTEGSHCSVCGVVIEAQEIIPVNENHDYQGIVTTPSTCTKKGVKTFTCRLCGDEYIMYIPMKSHSAVVDAAVAPSCTTAGLTAGSHCSVCGGIIEEQDIIPATGHTYAVVVTPPTCKEQGYTTYTCSVCGDRYVADYTAVTNNHDYIGIITTPATCTTKGIKTFTCSVCGDKYTEDVDMINHTAVTDSAVAPTCTVSGLTEGSHCSVCGNVITAQQVIPANGHSYNAVVTAPTCRDKGYTTYTCSVCQDSYRADYTDKLTTHDYSSAVTKQPTCATEGVKTFICSVCGNTYTEKIDKVAHTPVTDAAIAPTGTSTGLTEGSHCSVCGEVLTAQEVVPALIPEGASVKVNGDKAVITLSDGSTITVPKDTKETVKNADGTYTVTLNDGKSVTVS